MKSGTSKTKIPLLSAEQIRAIGKKWIDMVNDEHDDEKFSTGGFEEVPRDAGKVNFPGPSFDQLVSKENVESFLDSLAKLAAQGKRIANALEKDAKYQRDSATAMKRMVVEIQKHKRK